MINPAKTVRSPSLVTAQNLVAPCQTVFQKFDSRGPSLQGEFAQNLIDLSMALIIMRPSFLGGGRILRRTLSVRLSVCLSVRPVIVAIGNVFSSTASVTDVLFGTH